VPAGQGRCSARATGAASARARWCGPGPGVAGAVARVEGMRERERSRRKKGQAWVLYSLMFVGLTHQPTNISGLAYVAVGFKTDERNLKYELRLR
jgi:hypothetical protein